MPTTTISPITTWENSPNSCIISSSKGNLIIEIQGELLVPHHRTEDAEFISVDAFHDAVKFGKLVFNEKDQNKVTLFVGNSQRLLGSVVSLEKPLAILKVPSTEESQSVDMVDIIDKKILFKERPLPIM